MPPHDDHDHGHDHAHDHAHDHGHHHHDHAAVAFRIRSVRLYCGDLDGAVTFYRDLLGMPLLHQTVGVFAVFDTGEAQLTVERIAHNHPAHGELVGRFAGVSFAVPDLAATHGRLSAQGVPFLAPPQRQASGSGIAHFRDPAGNILSLVGRLSGPAA